MKYTENDLYKGMKLRCVSTTDTYRWKVGKQYEVEKRTDGLFILKDETGYIWNSWLILEFLKGKANCKMEIVEEEKEMTKYAKITKYAGIADKEYGLEIGEVYEIVSYYYECESGDCYIYLNEERPKYFISETQYELVEKEGPVALIEAKIEQLANEQTKLRNKRMRIKHQEEALRDKRMKLKEAKKSLEFLKQQNYL